MAGFFQATPWSYSPYSTLGTTLIGSPAPGAFGPPQGFGPQSPFGPQHVQQLQQLLQIIPQQIQQLQQTIQVLPQYVAQLVVQTLIQSQANAPSVGVAGGGVPFQSFPMTGAQFPVGQSGAVM